MSKRPIHKVIKMPPFCEDNPVLSALSQGHEKMSLDAKMFRFLIIKQLLIRVVYLCQNNACEHIFLKIQKLFDWKEQDEIKMFSSILYNLFVSWLLFSKCPCALWCQTTNTPVYTTDHYSSHGMVNGWMPQNTKTGKTGFWGQSLRYTVNHFIFLNWKPCMHLWTFSTCIKYILTTRFPVSVFCRCLWQSAWPLIQEFYDWQPSHQLVEWPGTF